MATAREQQFQDLKARLEATITNAEQLKADLESLQTAATTTNQQATDALTQTNTAKTQAEQIVTDLTAQHQTLIESVDKTSKREAETETLYDKLNKDISDLSGKASSIIKTSEKQQETIAEQLKKANAAGLFFAFDTEKTEHQKSALFWGISTGATLAVIIFVGIFLLADQNGHLYWSNISNVTQSSEAPLGYYLRKLALLSPLIYWLVLSTRQFSKARRLQEEYAFKSTLSLSLEAYRDMLRREAAETTTQTTVVPVLAKTMETIFTSPTESISKHPHKEDKDLLQQAQEIIASLTEVIKTKF